MVVFKWLLWSNLKRSIGKRFNENNRQKINAFPLKRTYFRYTFSIKFWNSGGQEIIKLLLALARIQKHFSWCLKKLQSVGERHGKCRGWWIISYTNSVGFFISDTCRTNLMQLLHFVAFIKVLLSCEGFTRSQEAVVDRTVCRPQNSRHDLSTVQCRFKGMFRSFVIHQLTWTPSIVVENQFFVTRHTFYRRIAFFSSTAVPRLRGQRLAPQQFLSKMFFGWPLLFSSTHRCQLPIADRAYFESKASSWELVVPPMHGLFRCGISTA